MTAMIFCSRARNLPDCLCSISLDDLGPSHAGHFGAALTRQQQQFEQRSKNAALSFKGQPHGCDLLI